MDLTNQKSQRFAQLGQGLVEYGLILAIIALVAMGTLHVVGHNLSDVLNQIASNLSGG